MLDTALGILIGLRRCRSDAAFEERMVTAHRNQVPVSAMAWGRVSLPAASPR
jgi:hypothetical protein